MKSKKAAGKLYKSSLDRREVKGRWNRQRLLQRFANRISHKGECLKRGGAPRTATNVSSRHILGGKKHIALLYLGLGRKRGKGDLDMKKGVREGLPLISVSCRFRVIAQELLSFIFSEKEGEDTIVREQGRDWAERRKNDRTARTSRKESIDRDDQKKRDRELTIAGKGSRGSIEAQRHEREGGGKGCWSPGKKSFPHLRRNIEGKRNVIGPLNLNSYRGVVAEEGKILAAFLLRKSFTQSSPPAHINRVGGEVHITHRLKRRNDGFGKRSKRHPLCARKEKADSPHLGRNQIEGGISTKGEFVLPHR